MFQNTFDLFNFTISNPNVVKDFPLQLLKLIAKDPSQPHKGPWNVTLDPFIVKLFVGKLLFFKYYNYIVCYY